LPDALATEGCLFRVRASIAEVIFCISSFAWRDQSNRMTHSFAVVFDRG
jgi:hypothetical protein